MRASPRLAASLHLERPLLHQKAPRQHGIFPLVNNPGYYRSAPRQSPEGLPIDIQPLTAQSYSEIPLVVAFLKSLSGEQPVITSPALP